MLRQDTNIIRLSLLKTAMIGNTSFLGKSCSGVAKKIKSMKCEPFD